MLINLRNALMSGKRLPYQCELEYLESTGTQFINTGIKFTTDNARVKFTASVVYASDKALCGSQNHSVDNNYGFVFYLYNNAMRVYVGATNTGANSSLADGNVHTVDLQASSGTLTKNIDGTISTARYNGTIVSGEDFTIFTSWRVASSSMTARCASGKIYSFQIWDNGVLVRDFIPVLDWSDVACMYDRVSGKLFYNAGTGDFVAGPEIHAVEYIESSGTQYLRTKLFLDSSDVVEGKAVFSNTNSLFGVLQTGIQFNLTGGHVSGVKNLRVYFGSGTAFNTPIDNINPHVVECGRVFKVDGVTYKTWDDSITFTGNSYCVICARNGNTSGGYTVSDYLQGKVYYIKVYKNGVLALNLVSIRVGSGSTWEGAMLDTVERKVYRNAGSGAFTYGNDLKYPIPAS